MKTALRLIVACLVVSGVALLPKQLVLADSQPGISVKVFPGHTVYMQGVVVISGGKTACYISDLIPTAAHIDLTWVMAFDLFPIMTIDSRRRYYAQALREKWLTVFTHGADTPWGYIEEDGVGKMAIRMP